jgi:hypothetical protein
MDAVRTGAVFSLLQGAFYQARTQKRGRPSTRMRAHVHTACRRF